VFVSAGFRPVSLVIVFSKNAGNTGSAEKVQVPEQAWLQDFL
jgi:hypothetical protein